MKRTLTIGLAVILAAVFATCTPGSGVKSGAAAGSALIKMLPRDTAGVIAVDVSRAMGTEATRKALQDPQAKAKYDEFVAMSGIDPMKDISYVGFGLSGLPGGAPGAPPEGGLIVQLKYDKAKLLGLIREKAPEAREEVYEGVTIYAGIDGTGAKQETRAAFLDDSHIVLGSDKGVKGIIDVHAKRAESLAKSVEMAAIMKKVDMSGLVWGAFAIPRDLVKKGAESTPQLKALEGVNALTMAFDYRQASFIADIRAHGGTKEQNDDLAAALNGFKAMGAMFGAQEPVVGELLNGIEIVAFADHTRLSVNIPQEVLDKLGQMAKARAGDFMKPKKDEVPEAIK